MNERKRELFALIIQTAEYVCGREHIPFDRRIQAFQPIEFVMQLDAYDRDACLDIRREVTRVVGDRIKREFEYSKEAALAWKQETFGPMPETELGEVIEQAYAEYGREMRHIREMYERRGIK